MAAMSIRSDFDIIGVEPAVRHPLVGHAESDHLLNFPKFDCLGKRAVITKVGHIFANFAPHRTDFEF